MFRKGRKIRPLTLRCHARQNHWWINNSNYSNNSDWQLCCAVLCWTDSNLIKMQIKSLGYNWKILSSLLSIVKRSSKTTDLELTWEGFQQKMGNKESLAHLSFCGVPWSPARLYRREPRQSPVCPPPCRPAGPAGSCSARRRRRWWTASPACWTAASQWKSPRLKQMNYVLFSHLAEINESYFYDIDVLFLVPSYPPLNFILGHFEISCQICSQFKYRGWD